MGRGRNRSPATNNSPLLHTCETWNSSKEFDVCIFSTALSQKFPPEDGMNVTCTGEIFTMQLEACPGVDLLNQIYWISAFEF